MIAVWENGFRHVTNSRQPIETPADPRRGEAPDAERRLAAETLSGPRCKPYADGAVRGLHRAPDRCDRRSGKPACADLGLEVVRGPGLSLAYRACIHAGVRRRLARPMGRSSSRGSGNSRGGSARDSGPMCTRLLRVWTRICWIRSVKRGVTVNAPDRQPFPRCECSPVRGIRLHR